MTLDNHYRPLLPSDVAALRSSEYRINFEKIKKYSTKIVYYPFYTWWIYWLSRPFSSLLTDCSSHQDAALCIRHSRLCQNWAQRHSVCYRILMDFLDFSWNELGEDT